VPLQPPDPYSPEGQEQLEQSVSVVYVQLVVSYLPVSHEEHAKQIEFVIPLQPLERNSPGEHIVQLEQDSPDFYSPSLHVLLVSPATTTPLESTSLTSDYFLCLHFEHVMIISYWCVKQPLILL